MLYFAIANTGFAGLSAILYTLGAEKSWMGDGWDDIFLLELHVLCDYAVLLYYFSENCRFQETIFWRAGNAFLRSRPAVYYWIRDIS